MKKMAKLIVFILLVCLPLLAAAEALTPDALNVTLPGAKPGIKAEPTAQPTAQPLQPLTIAPNAGGVLPGVSQGKKAVTPAAQGAVQMPDLAAFGNGIFAADETYDASGFSYSQSRCYRGEGDEAATVIDEYLTLLEDKYDLYCEGNFSPDGGKSTLIYWFTYLGDAEVEDFGLSSDEYCWEINYCHAFIEIISENGAYDVMMNVSPTYDWADTGESASVEPAPKQEPAGLLPSLQKKGN